MYDKQSLTNYVERARNVDSFNSQLLRISKSAAYIPEDFDFVHLYIYKNLSQKRLIPLHRKMTAAVTEFFMNEYFI